jgi:thiamine-monophosphate kinase
VPDSEQALLDWLRRFLDRGRPALIGDDAAKLRLRGDFAFTVDTQEEGRHFPRGLDAARVARRLLAVNLSDLAASGARPALGFTALAAPAHFDHRAFFRALEAAARAAGLRLAGGDLTASDRIRAAFFAVGRRPRGGRWLSRASARAGDVLWVGGILGESAAGRLLLARRSRLAGPAARAAIRRHLTPRPQLALGEWLGRRRRAAAIDVSDGFALDLHRLCRRSNVGARVAADALPAARGFAALCAALRVDPLSLQLAGGEDYVLLFTLPERVAPPAPLRCAPIGEITATRQVVLIAAGTSRPLPAAGWDHFAAASAGR